MALNPYTRKPLKVLGGLAAIVAVLLGLLAGANIWGTAHMVPKLGLDLEGGTQMVLEPVLVGSNKVSSQQLNQARDIIVQRVDANGVSGAEVTTRGGTNIVVSMPGQPDKATEDAISHRDDSDYACCDPGSREISRNTVFYARDGIRST